jgi:hypothetical protein
MVPKKGNKREEIAALRQGAYFVFHFIAQISTRLIKMHFMPCVEKMRRDLNYLKKIRRFSL